MAVGFAFFDTNKTIYTSFKILKPEYTDLIFHAHISGTSNAGKKSPKITVRHFHIIVARSLTLKMCNVNRVPPCVPVL